MAHFAGQEFERALELNPHYGQGRCWYALFYLQWSRGEFERGIAEARQALESDPLSAYATMILAICLVTAGRRNEETLATARLARICRPHNCWVRPKPPDTATWRSPTRSVPGRIANRCSSSSRATFPNGARSVPIRAFR